MCFVTFLCLFFLSFKGVPGFYGFVPRSFIISFIFGSLLTVYLLVFFALFWSLDKCD